jgi:hypothetical protein
LLVSNSQSAKKRFGLIEATFGRSVFWMFTFYLNLKAKAKVINVRVVGENPFNGEGRLGDVVVVERGDEIFSLSAAQGRESPSDRDAQDMSVTHVRSVSRHLARTTRLPCHIGPVLSDVANGKYRRGSGQSAEPDFGDHWAGSLGTRTGGTPVIVGHSLRVQVDFVEDDSIPTQLEILNAVVAVDEVSRVIVQRIIEHHAHTHTPRGSTDDNISTAQVRPESGEALNPRPPRLGFGCINRP